MDMNEYLARMIRVNHAGEFGAKQIYAGQIAILGNTEVGDTLRHMAEQEEVHLKYFEEQLQKRRIRPTAMHPVWRVLGFALGAGTAMLGKEAAMACTVAVEEVIDAHYEEQVQKLPANENELKKKILRFQAEELEHRDIGLENDAEKTPGYEFLYRAISTGCKAAIWISKRV
ncbi:MAG TPA: demethoxyubiquinone hydroxylase family protein [Alphaproteobacteria bacterium]|nr:demethoxyubiquinone hydroxylase family protein [Alphaproteobacteria bacterium]